MEQNNKQTVDNKPVQDHKNPITPTNPLKKEENIQAGKERMDADGGAHVKADLQQQNFSNPKKDDDTSNFVAPIKKPDVSHDQVKQH